MNRILDNREYCMDQMGPLSLKQASHGAIFAMLSYDYLRYDTMLWCIAPSDGVCFTITYDYIQFCPMNSECLIVFE